jgi:hypothetical protein
MNHIKVGGMSESGYALETVKRIQSEKLGDYTVLFAGPWSLEKVKALADFCKENKVYFVMDEMWSRLSGVMTDDYAKCDVDELRKTLEGAGEYFEGSLFMCEYGGLTLYWPESTVAGSPNIIPSTNCAADAKKHFVEKLRELIHKASDSVPGPLICIEASGTARYLFEAGIDRVDLEVTYDRFNELYFSATKGACLAYDRKCFGTDMAMVWYGGNEHNELWRHRWKTSLYHAFIRGADPIYAEHGLMDYKALGKKLDTGAPEVKMFRKELAGFADFAKKHPRPSGFPIAKIAVMYGNLDSFAMGEKHVWGQRGPDGIKSGSAEDSWELFNSFYRRQPWEFRYAIGDHDYSGNPPLGQVDVIPADCPLSLMRKYDCLIFLGWNTMTSEIYANLSEFVKHGGHLLATLAHLDTRTDRNAPISIVHNGDISELFGVTVSVGNDFNDQGVKFLRQPSAGNYDFPLWTAVCDPKYDDGGFPVGKIEIKTAEIIAGGSDRFGDSVKNIERHPLLTANRCGKGMAFLVNSTEYPGFRNLRRFYKDLLYHFNSAFQKDILVEAGDSVRFAVYPENGMNVIYLLNTDSGREQQVLISVGVNKNIPIMLRAGEMLAIYCTERCLVVPGNADSRITGIKIKNGKLVISKYLETDKLENIACFMDGREYPISNLEQLTPQPKARN